MMKSIQNALLLVTLCLIIGCTSTQQKEPEKKESEKKPKRETNNTKENIKSVHFDNFSDQEHKSWYNLHRQWKMKTLFPYLNKQDFQLACIECDNVYLLVQMTVNKAGKIVRWQILENHIECPKKPQNQINKLKSFIQQSWQANALPAGLRNKKITVRVGFVSKC